MYEAGVGRDLLDRLGRRLPQADPDGPSGNERLTATTGVVLLVLFALELVTLTSMRSLLGWHVSLGLALIPPVLLKLGSTGWRFARYYTRAQAYVAHGPPQLLLRVLAPLLVLATVVLLGTGVALVIRAPGRGSVLALHRLSFTVWLVLVGIHVLGHLPRVARLAPADWLARARFEPRGGRARRAALAGSLVVALVVGLSTVPVGRTWQHWLATHHHDHRREGLRAPTSRAMQAAAPSRAGWTSRV